MSREFPTSYTPDRWTEGDRQEREHMHVMTRIASEHVIKDYTPGVPLLQVICEEEKREEENNKSVRVEKDK